MRVLLSEPRRSYKLINHGPTTLITARAGDRTNVMAAAWVMPLDFDPPKIAAVIASDTYTRDLVAHSGELVLNLPTVAMADLTYTVGTTSGREIDKLEVFGIATAPASKVGAPLIEGCVGWLECRVSREPAIEAKHDLYVAEVVAAWYDDEVFVDGDWRFTDPSRRTIHHLSRGLFLASGERIEAARIPHQ